MTETLNTAHPAVDNDLYLEIQRFYARQMRLLDSAAVRDWANTFTTDGVFAAAGLEPVVGRSTIASAAGEARARLVAEGKQHRHWIGMLTVEPGSGEAVIATSYAMVIEVPLGGEPRLHRSTVCTDELVPGPDGWLVRRRQVARDDMP